MYNPSHAITFFRGGSKGVLHYSLMCSYAIISVEEIKCDLCMQKRRTRRLGNPVDCFFAFLKESLGCPL